MSLFIYWTQFALVLSRRIRIISVEFAIVMHKCRLQDLPKFAAEIPSAENDTKPSNAAFTSDSISFDFQTDVPIVVGTEQYYKYLVQYRPHYSAEWQDLPLIDHPDNVTTSRQVLNHTINNLAADTEYEVQVAVCRVWYGVMGECALASSPVVSITTG